MRFLLFNSSFLHIFTPELRAQRSAYTVTMVETKYRIAKENDSVVVTKVDSQARFTISFKRTIRVPDNDDQISALPPDMGNFPLYRVKDYETRLPKDLVQKGGLFLPIYRKLEESSLVRSSLTLY